MDSKQPLTVDPEASMHWLRALARPELALNWTLADWNRVVRLARRLRLLARLACSIESAGLTARVPEPVRPHLEAAQVLSQARSRAMLWAIERLPAMLGGWNHRVALLKGSAYMGQDLSIAAGRLPSDLDILVPRPHLDDFRQRLMAAGWTEPALDEHDQAYYLEWSHELPPMYHPQLGMELDVHHTILPPRSGWMAPGDSFVERLQPSRWTDWWVLHPVDQFLHSAGHLFHDSEPRDRVRDLVDMDGLMRHFGRSDAFWDELPRRAVTLHLVEALALACHFLDRWLATPMPGRLRDEVRRLVPDTLSHRFWTQVMAATLRPTEPDLRDSRLKRVAMTLVLSRYHVQRLPLRQQIPHLWHKLRKREPEGEPLIDPTANAP